MRIHYLQHVWFEDLGMIKAWAQSQAITVSRTAFFENEPLPEIEEIDWLIIMGGPMGVYDEQYKWLAAEKAFIKKAIDQNKKVLGVCLGAQLIADVLGAQVIKNKYKEIGWFPIRILDKKLPFFKSAISDEPKVFHWHQDTFSIPDKAILLAESDACAHQAFAYNEGNVVGLQFHLEMSQEGLLRIMEQCVNELTQGQYIQSSQDILSYTNEIPKVNSYLYAFLDEMKSIAK